LLVLACNYRSRVEFRTVDLPRITGDIIPSIFLGSSLQGSVVACVPTTTNTFSQSDTVVICYSPTTIEGVVVPTTAGAYSAHRDVTLWKFQVFAGGSSGSSSSSVLIRYHTLLVCHLSRPYWTRVRGGRTVHSLLPAELYQNPNNVDGIAAGGGSGSGKRGGRQGGSKAAAAKKQTIFRYTSRRTRPRGD
jgi:hypothetical protein